jgi:hypothetical protein
MPGLGIRLAVDTCVTHCSDLRTREDLRSRRCREFLRRVQECRYSVVYTQELEAEWDDHRTPSHFFSVWRTNMKKRGRLTRVNNDPRIRQSITDACARSRALQRSAVSEVLADIPLVESALIGDRRVASLDEAARAHFGLLSGLVNALGRIAWANPENSRERTIDWLSRGAPLEEKRLLRPQRRRP